MKRVITVLSALAVAACAQAQVVLESFSDASLWLPSGSSVATAGAVAGTVTFASPSGVDNWIFILPSPVSVAGFTDFVAVGRVNAGNTSTKVVVNLMDGDLNTVASFDISSFTTNFGSFTASLPSGLPAISYLQVTGDGSPTSAYNFSLDSLSVSAIPEPSTVALALGGVALAGAVVYRRRKTA